MSGQEHFKCNNMIIKKINMNSSSGKTWKTCTKYEDNKDNKEVHLKFICTE